MSGIAIGATIGLAVGDVRQCIADSVFSGVVLLGFVFAVTAAVVALKLPREALHAEKLVMATVKADGE